jgi:hypothetical protein
MMFGPARGRSFVCFEARAASVMIGSGQKETVLESVGVFVLVLPAEGSAAKRRLTAGPTLGKLV